MNKKFLNAILFGALAFSTVTFTACKDYDDDINSLTERVDAVEKTLSDLKTDFGNIAYVKDVSYSNGVLTVTPSSGNPVTYTISTTDKNTTYTLSVSQDGNKATITLTPSDGSAQSQTIEFIDTNTQLDPSLFRSVQQADGSYIVVYGDGEAAKETGITIPAQKNAVVVKIVDEKTNVTLGWSVDGANLVITDVLPITGFEYIPEKILSGVGERVIVFYKNNYQPVEIKNDAVSSIAGAINYLPNQATPKYHVNPSSATLAQLAEEGKAVIKNTEVEIVTRAAEGAVTWNKTAIENGIMTVTLEADPSMFTEETNKLDEIALQFQTTAGNSITTEYVGVINKSEELKLVLADKDVTAEDAKNNSCHFATTKQAAINQTAAVGTDNKATATTKHLVQQVTYSKAIAGIDLKELVTTCNIANGHKFFNYKDFSNFKLSFEAIPYTVNETPQEKYMDLSGEDNATFKAVNYDLTESESCIGKAPIVLAKLTDTYNNNELVAAAYIKLLIVGDEAAPAEDDIIINKAATIGIGCNNPMHTWSTNDEFMSTEVYTFAHKAEGSMLAQLSKEQFHTLYAFDATYNSLTDKQDVFGNTVSGAWTVTETINNNQGQSNHEVTFKLTTAPLEAKTYVAYAVYTKNTTGINDIANSNMYPEHVIIAYTVKVDDINFTASYGTKIANYWNGNSINIYCETPGSATTNIAQDMLTNFEGHKIEFTYNNYDADKYPSYAATNMDYKFLFSKDNLPATRGYVKDADNKEYQLYINEAGNKLYAIEKGSLPVINNKYLVASLSGDNNKDITYANTTYSKALLNVAPRGAANAFYAIVEISYFNGCDMEVPVNDNKFNANFIRPVNATANPDQKFEDGNNEGVCTLKLGELVNFTDWRNESPLNSFASNLGYYRFYGVTKIALDGSREVQTNLNRGENEFVDIDVIFGAAGASTLLDFNSKTVSYSADPTAIPDFGTVTYQNKNVEVNKAFKLRIPLVITYTWGTIKETIDVEVSTTL